MLRDIHIDTKVLKISIFVLIRTVLLLFSWYHNNIQPYNYERL